MRYIIRRVISCRIRKNIFCAYAFWKVLKIFFISAGTLYHHISIERKFHIFVERKIRPFIFENIILSEVWWDSNIIPRSCKTFEFSKTSIAILLSIKNAACRSNLGRLACSPNECSPWDGPSIRPFVHMDGGRMYPKFSSISWTDLDAGPWLSFLKWTSGRMDGPLLDDMKYNSDF